MDEYRPVFATSWFWTRTLMVVLCTVIVPGEIAKQHGATRIVLTAVLIPALLFLWKHWIEAVRMFQQMQSQYGLVTVQSRCACVESLFPFFNICPNGN